MELAKERNISLPIPDELQNPDIQAILYPDRLCADGRKMPDFEYIHKELARPGVTLTLLYICTECGTEEIIPEGGVEYFDIVDNGDINEPPTFSCESCDAIMRPQKYNGVHGITYEF